MSLNDDNISDLPPVDIDPSAVLSGDAQVQVGSIGSVMPTATAADDKVLPPSAILITPTAEPTFPDMKAGLAPIEGQVSVLNDLKQVEVGLKESGTVSQETATLVDRFTGNLFGRYLSLEEFTAKPSKVNYHETLANLGKKIAQEEVKLQNSLTEWMELPFKELCPVNGEAAATTSSEVFTDRVNTLVHDVATLQLACGDKFKTLVETKNAVLGIEGSFTNVIKEPLVSLVPMMGNLVSNLSGEAYRIDPTIEKFVIALKGLEQLLQRHELLYCVLAKDNAVFPPGLREYALMRADLDTLSLGDLLDLYDGKTLATKLATLQTQFNKALAVFTEVRKDLTESDPTKWYVLMLDRMADLATAVTTISYAHEAVKGFTALNYITHAIVEYLIKRV